MQQGTEIKSDELSIPKDERRAPTPSPQAISKLHPERNNAIVAAYSTGGSYREIGERYGLHLATIGRIIRHDMVTGENPIDVIDRKAATGGSESTMKPLRHLLLAFVAVLLSAGCATGGGKNLHVEAQDEQGVEFMPDEPASMLADLDYRWVPIHDPDIGHKVRVAMQQGYYLMQFEHAQSEQVRIDARIRIRDNATSLHFYEIGSSTLSERSQVLYDELKKRADLEFGSENVR